MMVAVVVMVVMTVMMMVVVMVMMTVIMVKDELNLQLGFEPLESFQLEPQRVVGCLQLLRLLPPANLKMENNIFQFVIGSI